MPTYEFRCRACGTTFTQHRPMDASDAPASCPQGHADSVRLLTTLGLSGSGGRAASSVPTATGGCCGGGCGCG